ncbi:hypothetical protein L1049_017543 [Liquidambar formosana]|uniref:Rx N-terminal domain-containing protein n=1 Tax=Liquidambar formosana TaxID=63359 RepID=A0AAP0X4D4_LIQFO
MVDAIVSFAVERLGDLLIREVTSLQGVKDEVEWLKNELGRMQCFLQDAEEKQGGDNRQAIGKWIKDVKDVAYDAEDVIDTFILKTLKFVDIYEWITINPVNLINLRELRITTLSKRDFNPQKQSKTTLSEEEPKEFTWDPIASLTNLQSLSVDLPSPMYFPSIQPLSNCQHLLQLMIYGRVENLPEQMHEYLPNLKYLKLENSQLMRDPMPTLEKLPNLMILELASNDDLKKLICTANGFAQLEILTLDQFYYLEELEVEEEAMPMLRGLRVVCCDKFTVPERLRSFLDSSNSDWDLDWDWAKLPRFARMRI